MAALGEDNRGRSASQSNVDIKRGAMSNTGNVTITTQKTHVKIKPECTTPIGVGPAMGVSFFLHDFKFFFIGGWNCLPF